MSSPGVAWQASLLDAAEPEPDVDLAFSGLARIQLDPTAWVDHQPAWVSGSDELFSRLLTTFEWAQRSRRMYDKTVREPRLTSWWGASSGRELEPAVLEKMRHALSDRYGVELDSMGLNLYRDGQDSVAWHGDRIAKHIEEPIVAIVSLGEPRRFQLRPRVPGPAPRTFMLGRGDLLVTGGRCQRTWLHSVPKVAKAGPRISITFRHGLDARAYPESPRRDS